jgi:hypothetical protein
VDLRILCAADAGRRNAGVGERGAQGRPVPNVVEASDMPVKRIALRESLAERLRRQVGREWLARR